MNRQEVLRLLAKDRWVAFATVDAGQPRVRMMTVKCHMGKLWCFTSTSSAKADQLRQDDRFEFVVHLAEEEDAGSLRAMGRAEIVEDFRMKEELSASFPPFKDHWQSFEDPDFMLLRLNVESVEIERGPDAKAERFTLERI